MNYSIVYTDTDIGYKLDGIATVFGTLNDLRKVWSLITLIESNR